MPDNIIRANLFSLRNSPKLPKIVKKDWGEEVWFANNEEYNYCGKILRVNAGHKFSMHAHRDKAETFYVLKGSVILRIIDSQSHDATVYEMNMTVGDVFDIKPMLPHQIEAREYSEIIEASTFHRDEDSYRYWR